MMDGASPYEIDAALRAFSYPWSPTGCPDPVAGGIGWATRRRRCDRRDRARYVHIADRLCDAAGLARRPGAATTATRQRAHPACPIPVLAIVDAERAAPASRRAPLRLRRSCAAILAAMVQRGITT